VHFYKVKTHSGIIGNECADAIAKHTALHNDGQDERFLPPNTDGNPYSHLHWLAAEELARKRSTPNSFIQEPKLVPLQNLKVRLKKHHDMHQQHCLENASGGNGILQGLRLRLYLPNKGGLAGRKPPLRYEPRTYRLQGWTQSTSQQVPAWNTSGPGQDF